MNKAFVLFVLFLLGLCLPPHLSDAQVLQHLLEERNIRQPQGQWQINADKVEASHDQDVIEAWGGVTLWQGDSFLQADYAKYYSDTQWVYLKGNVKIKWRSDYLESREAEFDLRNQVGWLKNGQVFVADPHLYFRGETIRKLAGDSYSFTDARITTCDVTPAPWSLSAGEGEITLDGTAQLRHVALRIEDNPVLYSPYGVLPVVIGRQTGFLLPEVSLSTLLGAQLNIPFYVALDPEHDLTLYENYMSKRGLMQGVEFRLATDPLTKGLWHVDWLYDNIVSRTEADEPDGLNNDKLVRPNHNRFWLRGKYDGYLDDPRWQTKFDVDYVSDQDYLREFKRGASGFNKTREDFLSVFKRDIAENDSMIRPSTFLVSRDYDYFGVAGRLQYSQNLAYMNGNNSESQNPTLQRVPDLYAMFYRSTVGSTPLEWEADNTASYFWRQYGTSGGRVDLHPDLSLPLRVGPVSIIPTTGLRQTLYGINTYQNESSRVDESSYLTRTLPDIGVSAFTESYRVFDLQPDTLVPSQDTVGQANWAKVKHSIQPRVNYSFIPNVGQSRLPIFDNVDRIDPRSDISYSLTNLLTRRRDTVVGRSVSEGQGSRSGEDGDLVYTLDRNYLEVVNFRIEQDYDFREAERVDQIDQFPRRPFSDILFDLTVRLDKRLSIVNRTFLSPYQDVVTEHEHLVRYEHEDYGSILAGLDYLKPLNEYKRMTQNLDVFNATNNSGLTLEGLLKVKSQSYNIIHLGGEIFASKKLTLGMDYRYDYKASTDIEKSLFIVYLDQCFNLRLEYDQTPLDQRVEVRVDILGLTSVGNAGPK